MSKIAQSFPKLALAALLLLSLSIPYLVAHYAVAPPLYWNTSLLLDAVLWTVGVIALSALFKSVMPHRARPLLISVLLIYLAIGIGIASTLTTVYFIASSYLLGRLALHKVSTEDFSVALFDRALLVGLAIYICLFSALIHFPVNYQLAYLAILVVPFLLISRAQRGTLLNLLSSNGQVALSSLRTANYGIVVVLTLVIGYIARFSFFPSVGFDDNVLHLRLWTELTQFHFYSFDIEHQIWSVAPFAIDLLHSSISLAGSSDARGALNIAMLVIILRAIWIVSSSLLNRSIDKALVLLLFCSTPILSNLLTTLQTELFLALLATLGVKVLLEEKTTHSNSRSLAVLAAAALCAATKLPGMVLGFTFIVAYVPILLREKISFRRDPRAFRPALYILLLIILTTTALQSYLYSWYVSANPLFPLYNEIFKSPYFAIRNFSDPLYQKGFSFESFWSIFYDTSAYYESGDFVAGFQYLYLLPFGLLALIFNKRLKISSKVSMILPTLGFGLVMFAASQYWRYLFPVVPLASVIVGALLYKTANPSRTFDLAMRCVFGFFIITNLFFLPGVTWFFSSPAQLAYTSQGKLALTETIAPSKSLTAFISKDANNPSVLYDPNATLGATLLGKPIYVNWYAPKQREEYDEIKTQADVLNLLERKKIDYVVWDSTLSVTKANRNAMLQVLTTHGQPVSQAGPLIAYKISKDEVAYKPFFNIHTQQAAMGSSTQTQQSLIADPTPRVIATIDIGSAQSAKYNVTFQCTDASGSFIAQINWNVLPVYYKLIPCVKGQVNFTETLPIPQGATSGNVYITARDREKVEVVDLNIGLN